MRQPELQVDTAAARASRFDDSRGLVRRLLTLASQIAPESNRLRTDDFRRELSVYQSALEQGPLDERELEHFGNSLVTLVEKFFLRSKSYLEEREQEVLELVSIVQQALASLSGRRERLHGELLQTNERLHRLSDIDDIRVLKAQLAQEVADLGRTLVSRQNEEQKEFGELTKRVEVLETKLEQSRVEATTDPLTEIPNRRGLEECLRAWTARAKNDGHSFAVAMVDLDDFKRINDLHGHLVGDRVLKCTAQELSRGIRPEDFVARYGGEEFVVLLSGARLKEARQRMSELVTRIAGCRYKYLKGSEERWVSFTVSAGLTNVTRSDEIAEILQRADQALYQAKQAGKNTVAVKRAGLLDFLG